MQVLITGGMGYLGGRIANHLIEKGYEVLLTTRKKEINYKAHKKIKLVKHDNKNYDAIAGKLIDTSCIIHLAGPNAQFCSKLPEKSIEFRKASTESLLNIARERKIRKFIYVSTAHVYRDPLIGEINEDTELTNDSPYAVSHQEAEKLLLNFSENCLLTPAVVRLANVFGSPANNHAQCWHLLGNSLALEVSKSNIFNFTSPPNSVRNFITISDFCNAIFFLLKEQELKHRIFNLGGVSLTTYGLYELIQSINRTDFEGFKKKLLHLTSERNYDTNVLKYNNKNFLSIGFKCENNIKNELLTLLNFCKTVQN